MSYEKKEVISWRGIDYEVNRQSDGDIFLVRILSKLDQKLRWANRILAMAPNHIRFIHNQFETIALDTRNHRWSKAVCTREDIRNFNEKIGKALAVAKLRHQTIPHIFYE